MTSALEPVAEDTAEIPPFPMARAAGCPFDPPPGLRASREAAPLTRVRLWDGSTPWLVTTHAEQRALLADPRLSSDVTSPGFPKTVPSSGGGLSFITKDDPEHARLRRMVTGAFTVRRVEALRPAVRRIVDDRIDELLAGPRPADLVAAFALPVPSLVICELLGVPYADHPFFQENSRILITRTTTPEERAAALARLTDYLRELVTRKLRDPADDLLSGLVGRIGAGELSVAEAAEMGVLLLVAGHETTANMIALGTALLLQHPDQLALVRDAEDPAVVASAVEELLRFLNITHSGLRRRALADIEIAGRVIRAGEGVILPNDIGNRDPDAFPEPDRLDVRRNPRRHMAFGFGVHQCLGQPLARLELQVVYGTLYRRVPTLRLAADVDRLPFKHDGSVYGVHELPVTW
ncbi:cytochrome P450 [Streptomyces sp. NPDC127098]|uniref:cytochrome P450 n=1 Tax=Streptomyces sp. NPDC127098 TaxID=3347137 RepID=UPI00364CECE8